VAFATAATLTENAAKTRPISKVIKMLEDMRTQLNAEMADDHEVFEKLSCWCKTNDREKTESIRIAEAKIAALESTIKELAAAIAEGEAKIIAVKNEYNKDWDALKTATEMRMKESAAFAQSEKDFLQVIDACKQAVIVLSKHHPELAQLRAAAYALSKDVVHNVVKPGDRLALQKFLDETTTATSFLEIPGYKSYSSQSGQVFGILKQMRSDFESNLSDAQKEEQDKRAAFADLKKAKEAQMAASRKQQANFEEELADNLEKKAQAEEDLHDTETQHANDTEFLAKLRHKCETSDEEYHARVKSRQEEIGAVTETIQILDSDQSFEVATRSLPKQVGFLQLQGSEQQAARKDMIARVNKILAPLAKIHPRIALVAMSARLDAFTKVKAAIDGMIAELQAEKKDEIKHRDFCINEFNKNEREQNAKMDERDDLQIKKDQLTSDIKELTEAIDTLNSEVKEMQTQMQRASENREAENAEFQNTVNDQRVTQAILRRARDRMAQKYEFLQAEPRVGGAHTVTSATKTDPGNAPVRFDRYKHSGDGARVLTMLDRIIADSEHYEQEQITDEQNEQRAYEGFIDDSNNSIKLKNKAIANKSENRAVADENLTIAKGDHASALTDMENLNNYKGQLHGSCDFVLKNFNTRQDARDDEVRALREAKDILSGAGGQ